MSLKDVKHTQGQTHIFIDTWDITPDQHWLVFSAAGNQGTLLAQMLSGKLNPEVGNVDGLPSSVGFVSLSAQQGLLEDELANDDTDFIDQIDHGSTVEELLIEYCDDRGLLELILNDLDLVHLRSAGFRQLSTGESRRVMLARAIISQPDILILDEPYSGLDVSHRHALTDYLQTLSTSIQIIVLSSRLDDIPDFLTHAALFSTQSPTLMTREQWNQHPLVAQLLAQSGTGSDEMAELVRNNRHQTCLPDPLVTINNGRVAYTDKTIFQGVNWQIRHGEHWQIRGPNGCGKSTLLGLIFGDHPQCYSNDIEIFGFKRGSGETIWDIKRHIGMVSSALHLEYRVNCSALDTIISGLHDSIGLYQKPTKTESAQAMEWLKLFHMESLAKTSFRRLEYGQQRLLLIARALIKRPALLILDEPYQGLDFLDRLLVANALEMIAKENLSQLLLVSHHKEDVMAGIHHFIDFEPETEGYRIRITQKTD
ncbi:ABC transporter [Veronia pacifica]|uniref:ABC transporter n=1 Tax=Veronia pacifica TaxID=1080227 RepID=A0A1C3EGD1_9GAMM|nr:ABC transporter [Veronia pacifica]